MRSPRAWTRAAVRRLRPAHKARHRAPEAPCRPPAPEVRRPGASAGGPYPPPPPGYPPPGYPPPPGYYYAPGYAPYYYPRPYYYGAYYAPYWYRRW